MFGSHVVLTLMITLIPESPKFFYARSRFDDARKSLYFVATVNQSPNAAKIKEVQFDTEGIVLKDEGNSAS